LNFLLVIESRDFNFAKNRLRPISMKLGTMLEIDETFTTSLYDFQGHPRSGSW